MVKVTIEGYILWEVCQVYMHAKTKYLVCTTYHHLEQTQLQKLTSVTIYDTELTEGKISRSRSQKNVIF